MKKLTKRELSSYVGDFSQVLGIRECILQGGKSRGVRAYEIKNGRGLELTVLADKCLNIPYLSYKGINIGFISKAGICAPEYYQENRDRGFLRNFEAGFLTTCGLTYMGSSCEENGRELGLHGPISNTPAENVSSSICWKDDVACMTVRGNVREACLFEENLILDREFKVNSAENKIKIHDIVENRGFQKEPLMLLYHFNFGYPMLDGCTKVYTNFDQITGRDPHSAQGIEKCDEFSNPVIGFEEEVFFRTMSSKERREAIVVIYNEELQIAATIKFDSHALPVLNHWKNPRAGDYGLGIEPGTSHVGGRVRARKEKMLMEIDAGEVKEFDIEIEFFDCKEEIEKQISFTR